jgi:hypothetical protein
MSFGLTSTPYVPKCRKMCGSTRWSCCSDNEKVFERIFAA